MATSAEKTTVMAKTSATEVFSEVVYTGEEHLCLYLATAESACILIRTSSGEKV